MAILLMLAFLLMIGIAAPRFGADSRSSREWARTDPATALLPQDGMGSRW